jgi:protease I
VYQDYVAVIDLGTPTGAGRCARPPLHTWLQLRDHGLDFGVSLEDFVAHLAAGRRWPGYSWPANVAFADVNPADYVALVIPGGRAPEYIRNDPDVQRIVRHFMDADRPVAQLCHAPQVLAAAGALTGRRTAAYPVLAPDVAAAGAEFVDGAAVIDGQMVSARAWPDHPAWMREFMRILRSKAPSEA